MQVGCTERVLDVAFLSMQAYEVQLSTNENPADDWQGIEFKLTLPTGTDKSTISAQNFTVTSGAIVGDLSCIQDENFCSVKLDATPPVPGSNVGQVEVTFNAVSLEIVRNNRRFTYEFGSKSLVIQVDSSLPEILSFVINEGKFATNLTQLPYAVTGTKLQEIRISDTVACSSGAWLPVSGTFSFPTVEGAHIFYAQGRDNHGNLTNCISSNSVVYDNTKPIFTVSPSSPAMGSSSTVFTWVINYTESNFVTFYPDKLALQGATDDCILGTVIAGTQITVTAHSCSLSGALLLGIAEGYLEDAAGNKSAALNTDSVTLDNIPPLVTITSPLEMSLIPNQFVAVNLSGTCNKNGRPLSFSHVPMSPVTCAGSTWNAQFNLSAVSSYFISIQVELEDALGRKNTASRLLRLPSLQVVATQGAFAVLIPRGKVYAWGDSALGGNGVNLIDKGDAHIKVYANPAAFAAIRSDGLVSAWGDSARGGDATSVASEMGVAKIYANDFAFAGVKNDGSVIAWGNPSYGGSAPIGLNSVTKIYNNSAAFAAVRSNGSVTTWGSSVGGGNSSAVALQLMSGVATIVGTEQAFSALKTDKTVVAWGASSFLINFFNPIDVKALYSNRRAFAAVKENGSVECWGDLAFGGTTPSSLAAANSGVTEIVGTFGAFAAIKNDGTVQAWGGSDYGGVTPSTLQEASAKVKSIASNYYAFVAIRENGTVVSWGGATCGMDCGGTAPAVLREVDDANFSPVVKIYSNQHAFAALRQNGSVVTWGYDVYGGDSSAVAASLTGDVVAIYSTLKAFMAVKSNNHIVTWGTGSYGGDSSAAQAILNQ